MKINKLALIVAIAALACGAFAQGGGGGGRGQRGGGGPQFGPMALLRMEEVQKEIGLTDDQKTKVTELAASTRTKSQEARTAANGDRQAAAAATLKINEEALGSLKEILKPEQMKRLHELEIQWSGKAIVARNKEVQAELGLSDEQKTKLTDLLAKQQAANAEVRTSANGDRQAMQEGMAKNAKILEDEIDKVLTDAQKSKLKDMGGKEMARPAPPQRGGGGGGL